MERFTITGAIDGVNAVFTLNEIPTYLKMVRNGVRQEPAGVDYTLVGNTVTFAAASIPQTGDLLQALGEHA